jgi:aminopeptidase N
VLSDESNRIEVESEITLRFKTDGINKLRLDLVNKSDTINGQGMLVLSIQHNGKNLKFTHKNNELIIYFSTPSIADSVTQLNISYSGIPADGLIIGPTKYGNRSFFSHDWPNKARHWLSVIDHPYEKATCEFLVTAPIHYDVVSNGLLIERTTLDKKTRLTHWKQSVPISAWLYVLGVAEFAVQYVDTFDGKSIETWVYPQNKDEGFRDFAEPTKKVLQFLSDYVGSFAYEKIANVQSASVGGAMETASAIFYQETSITGSRTFWLNNAIIHELAHQWFGNAVTESTWDDSWLSEGFATYFTMLFREHAYGRDDFINELHKAKQKINNFYLKDPDYKIISDRSAEEEPVTSLMTYQKGAWVLHMLRNLVGDDSFKKGVQSYYKKYFNSTASTNDFRLELEKTSGKDLTKFFNQWLYQGGNIKLNGTWKYEKNKGQLVINLNQVQDKKYTYDIPIEIGIFQEGNQMPEISSFQLSERENEFIIPLTEQPQSISIDPNTKLLAEWELRRVK